jgi:hypothetical protein
MVRSVLVSGVFGWAMLRSAVSWRRRTSTRRQQGDRAFVTIVQDAMPSSLAITLFGGIAVRSTCAAWRP